MKLFKQFSIYMAGAMALSLASCENADRDFDDYEGGTSVYFAYQYPVRTIVLGEDVYDTTLDNQHKCKIYATMGGAYEGRNIKLNIETDNTLCDNLYFEDGTAVQAMPDSYYSLAGNTISYDGKMMGGVEVQLTDDFFADPNSLKNTYIIPVVIKSQTGADRILNGKPLVDGDTPQRTNSAYWDIQPKDYTLYCVKYINKYHAYYLRRGKDKITEGGNVTTVVRHQPEVESDEVCMTTTSTLTSVLFPVSTQVEESGTVKTLTCDLLLTFNDDNTCTITSATPEFTASGSGEYKLKSEKKAWGNKDRDGLYLNYKIDFGVKQYETADTLVWRNRGVKGEEFIPKYQE